MVEHQKEEDVQLCLRKWQWL